MGLDVEDELPSERLRARQHQLRFVRLGLLDLEYVAAVDLLHGEESRGHAAARAHELPAAQPEPFAVGIGQFENPPLEPLPRLALRAADGGFWAGAPARRRVELEGGARSERMHFTVGFRLRGHSDRVMIDAEDALIAALRVKAERPEALITYVRHQNKRGDPRHPSQAFKDDRRAG